MRAFSESNDGTKTVLSIASSKDVKVVEACARTHAIAPGVGDTATNKRRRQRTTPLLLSIVTTRSQLFIFDVGACAAE